MSCTLQFKETRKNIEFDINNIKGKPFISGSLTKKKAIEHNEKANAYYLQVKNIADTWANITSQLGISGQPIEVKKIKYGGDLDSSFMSIHQRDLIQINYDQYVIDAIDQWKKDNNLYEEKVSLIEYLNYPERFISQEDRFVFEEPKVTTAPTNLTYNPPVPTQLTIEFPSSIKPGVSELFDQNPELANAVYEALGFNNLRKEYSNIIIDQVWKRLANEGITNADSLIGTRETINNKDFNKFWSAVKDVDIQNVIKFFESEKQKALDSYSKYKGEFDPTTGTFTSNDTSFFDNKIKDLNTLLQQKQQAQQLYQSFLDAYLQDFEQVESILKEEKIIDKKCS